MFIIYLDEHDRKQVITSNEALMQQYREEGFRFEAKEEVYQDWGHDLTVTKHVNSPRKAKQKSQNEKVTVNKNPLLQWHRNYIPQPNVNKVGVQLCHINNTHVMVTQMCVQVLFGSHKMLLRSIWLEKIVLI